MSKNPPKPNTSPDHVKETAEAYTCPSHIEARERLPVDGDVRTLAEMLCRRDGRYDPDDLIAIGNGPLQSAWKEYEDRARTLLATPTQGRDRYATEEEICRIVRAVYDAGARGAEPDATFVKAECDLLALHGIDGLNSDADVPAQEIALTGRVHELKTWPEYFEAVASDRKRFEIRQNDRRFAVGDTLLLREWDPETEQYTGRSVQRAVSYILDGAWMFDGYVALSLLPAPKPQLRGDVSEAVERFINSLNPKNGEVRASVPALKLALETILPAPKLGEGDEPSFQARVQPWMMACFGPEISGDKLERGDRHLEEVLELLQSGDYPAERVTAIRDYVYGRPKGEPKQEAGGVMVTLAAYCLAHDIDMHEAGEAELARIWTKVEQIRAKQASKPVGSALPIATAPGAPEGLREALAGLITYVESNTCTHENTKRGGAIWTICEDCGRKWADDEGGFEPYAEPHELSKAKAALTSSSAKPVGELKAQVRPFDETLSIGEVIADKFFSPKPVGDDADGCAP